MENFEPKILAFMCERRARAEANSGLSGAQYPPNIRFIPTCCAGRVDPLYILEALKKGFDQVLVSGCHIGYCPYHDGNEITQRRIHLVADLFEVAGIDRRRVALRRVNASDERSFSEIISELMRTAADIGPFDRERYHLQLAALEAVLQGQKIRWLIGLDRQSAPKDNIPEEMVKDEGTFQKKLGKYATDEYETAVVLEVLRTDMLSVHEMAVRTGLPIPSISIRIKDLERLGLAERRGSEGRDSKFRRLAA